MTTLIIAAFFMGVVGSMHCVGMCGPIALSLPVVPGGNSSRFVSTLLYNLGRAFTYAVIGAVAGLVGSTLGWFGFQQWLSIALGVAIIIVLVIPGLSAKAAGPLRVNAVFAKLRGALGKLFDRANYRSVFSIGLLNGLLPCGLIYMAVAAAISTASVGKSSLFMLAFGLGTIPVMWSIAFFGNYLNFRIRARIRSAYPYLMAIMACLLIIRGLGLGIPYLSPEVTGHDTVVECHD